MRLLVAAILLLGAFHLAFPCAIAWQGTVINPVQITSETALIYWDSLTNTEHFFRSAEFDSRLKKVGFIVPTPSPPKLAAAPGDLFDSIQQELHPVIHEDKRGYKFVLWRSNRLEMMLKGVDSASAVNVVSTQDVAGYKATVVNASDAGALSKWLADNGFSTRPALTKWLDFYVKKGWTFTAFRFDPTQNSASFRSPLIRISFRSRVPIYPYQEPDDTSARKGRSLRLYFASNVPYEPDAGSKFWKSTVESSSFVNFDFNRSLAGFGPTSLGSSVRASWLTSYLDRSPSRRGQPDLTFEPSKYPATMAPKPTILSEDLRFEIPITTWFPTGAFLLLMLSAGVIQFRKMWHADDESDAEPASNP